MYLAAQRSHARPPGLFLMSVPSDKQPEKHSRETKHSLLGWAYRNRAADQ